ncbi:DegT/DnrJ/EryC1/StrS family aminotransferase, partial [Lacticaseibacillus paracasei]
EEFIRFFDAKYDAFSAHNLLPLLIDFEKLGISKKQLILTLQKQGIGTQVHFIPLYRHPYFQKHFHFEVKDFPNTEQYYLEELSFPLFPHMT